MNHRYKVRYLPLFEEDLREIVLYISQKLKNSQAAEELVNKVEEAIWKRSYNPLSFEVFISVKDRQHRYYRIYVKNYTIYYVVIGDIMEVRRILYKYSNKYKS